MPGRTSGIPRPLQLAYGGRIEVKLGGCIYIFLPAGGRSQKGAKQGQPEERKEQGSDKGK